MKLKKSLPDTSVSKSPKKQTIKIPRLMPIEEEKNKLTANEELLESKAFVHINIAQTGDLKFSSWVTGLNSMELCGLISFLRDVLPNNPNLIIPPDKAIPGVGEISEEEA